MVDTARGRSIQLYFTIRSPPPLLKLLRHPSRLVLKFSLNGIDEQMLSTRRGAENGIWKLDGDVKIYKDQLLTATILLCVEDFTKKLCVVTGSYSQLLAHAEARSSESECYEFNVDGSISLVLMFVTCSIRTSVLLPRTWPISSPGKSKSDTSRIGNRALTSYASPAPRASSQAFDYVLAERKGQTLNEIGCVYRDAYRRTNKIEYLERAITILGENAKSYPKVARHINNFALCLYMRFLHAGNRTDLENAISKSRDAIDIAEIYDPNRSTYFGNHANALRTRFECLGRLEDLQASIPSQTMAVELTTEDNPEKAMGLCSLAIAYETRFDRLGRIEDLETSLALKQKAVSLIPDGHPQRPIHLNNLGRAFMTRFNRLGRIEDVDTAIVHNQNAVDLTPDGHPKKPIRLNNLACAFEMRFRQLGRVKDMEADIMYAQQAVDLTPDGHINKPTYLSNLGNAFEKQFKQSGRVEDLETSIAHRQKAVDLTPDGHPSKPVYLVYLGNTLQIRFVRLGRVEDLEIALAHKQKAVDLTPEGHPEKPGHLSSLGEAFVAQFHQSGCVNDLETSIMYEQKAVDLTPDGHPSKPTYLMNLGNAFQSLFERLGRVEDLETSIAHKQKGLDLTPDGYAARVEHFDNLANAFEARFEQFDRVEDLEITIAHRQKALDLIPDGHPDKPKAFDALGYAFWTRFVRLCRVKDLEKALIHFSTAASLPTGSPRIRLDAAVYWAICSESLQKSGVPVSSPLEPYRVAIDLLPRVAWLGIPMSTQHSLLEKVGGIVREAVCAAIKVEEYERAVEWAEAGRSIAWQNLLNLRTPVNELRGAHYDLADRLETISRQLDMSVRGGDGRMLGGTEVPRSHVQLALDWDNTVADIRSKPGFESFLKPKSFNQLRRVAHNGPVVILNIAKSRCNALVLLPEDNGNFYISNISLSDFSYAKSETLLTELKGLLSSKHLRDRDIRKMTRIPVDGGNGPPLAPILRCLWLDVVKPIIEALAYQPRSEDLPHIWWCATGPLAFLPIHAAGLYDIDEPGNKLSDYVISSYAPTLSALLDDSTPSQKDFKLLAIAQANAPGASPIPETEVEVKKIQTVAENIKVTTMMKEEATVENVWRGMEESSWVHLACHGQQNINEPMKSGLLLHDGTLELQRLIEKPLPFADFAFLSACQTATGDENIAEESLHLAAGMLFAGYKGVIATMWSIMDEVGPRVAEDVYREMLKDGKPNRKVAAYALHKAVNRLREDPKICYLGRCTCRGAESRVPSAL